MKLKELTLTVILFFLAIVMNAQPAKDTVPFICNLPAYEMPQFPGGNDSLKSYIRRNLRWPGPFWDGEGVVYVRFKIDCEGKISEAKVIRGIDSLANKEALRLVNNMPRWTGMDCEKCPNPMLYNLPVKFKLD